jgi:hypothetical protein
MTGEFPSKLAQTNNPMKTNLSFRIFKLYTLVPLGIAISAAVVPQPVSAGVINAADTPTPTPVPHQLVFTENPAGRLTVTFDGSSSGITVTPVSTDRWNVIIPVTATAPGAAQWIEPENSSLVNIPEEVATDTYLVRSDVSPQSFSTPVPNGTPTSFGNDPSDGRPIIATFHDNAARTEVVPDTGSTFALLLLSLIGLFCATRLRSVRLA